jgi:hypothetical protein
VTDDDAPPGAGVGDGVGVGVGVGDGEGVEEPLPQAIANTKIVDTTARRSDNIKSSEHAASENTRLIFF